jgi:hypothetical protein
MKVALWTPRRGDGGPVALVRALEDDAAITVVDGPRQTRPDVDLDLYHLDDDPVFAFVYRALRERPGVVLLDAWNLHRLVHAVTAGDGNEAAYRREARHAHGERGDFVARQVLAGLGGQLPTLVPFNERVMEGALGVVATSPTVRDRVAARLPARPVLLLPAGGTLAGAGAPEIRELVRSATARVSEAHAALAARRAREDVPAGRALEELEIAARELGVSEAPPDVAALVDGLFAEGAP